MTKDEGMTKPEVRNGSVRSLVLLVRHSSFGLLSSFVILVSSFSSTSAQQPSPDSLRAERVGWARLKTAGELWRRHADSDPLLMRFFREHTTLNIDPTWYSADAERLDEMCAYPLLFAQSLAPVQSATGVRNLGEYMRRGGFLIIDACINPQIRGNPDFFVARQKRALLESLPEVRFALLAHDHEIFRCFFFFPDGPPRTAVEPEWDHGELIGVYLGSRMAAVITTSGLQCGWAGMRHTPGHSEMCMKMLVNIYLYAMTGGGEMTKPE
jgi:hypothetical protein